MRNSLPGNRLQWPTWFFAAGAVFWLILLTQFAAELSAPVWRAQFLQSLASSGLTRDAGRILVVGSVFIVFFEVCAIAVNAAAYYGLRRFRAWGWAAATVAAAGWSLVLIGIPVLAVLLRRQTREACGVP